MMMSRTRTNSISTVPHSETPKPSPISLPRFQSITFHSSPLSSSFNSLYKIHKPFHPQIACFTKSLTIRASSTTLIQISKSPTLNSVKGNDLVVFGGGHAATITVRASKKGLVKLAAIAAVAPTWAGPLAVVFGRDSSMEAR